MALFMVLVATLSVQTAMAPSATADSISVSVDLQPDAEFSLRGSNGYSLKVKGADRRVELTAVRRGQRAEYEVRGEASAEGIEAQFGGLGTVAVEFQPSGRTVRKQPLRDCEGTTIIQHGIFVGTIEFTGENGYTKVRETQAAGRTLASSQSECGEGTGPKLPPPTILPRRSSETGEVTLLEVRAKGKHFFFAAIRIRNSEEPDFAVFSASLIERRGRMLVARSGSTFAPLRTFKFNEALTFASVNPPKPFEGGGTFQRASGGKASLTGSLTVSLPGAEDVALTGSRIKARLFETDRE